MLRVHGVTLERGTAVIDAPAWKVRTVEREARHG